MGAICPSGNSLYQFVKAKGYKMGFLKKVSNFAFGSSGPKYNQDASALTQQYGVQSDLGNLNLVKNADGTYSKNYTSSANDQTRNALIGQQLGNINLDTYTPQTSEYTFGSVLSDPTKSYNPKDVTDPTTGYTASQLYGNINQDTANNAAQSYYDQATRLLNNQFDRQRTTADTNLINRGIQTGTDQYNQVMGDLQDRQNATLSDIANQSVFQGQNLLSTMLGNQAQQTANEGAVFDNQGRLINNQAGLLSNQGRQLSNEGSYYANLGQILANQGQQVSNEGGVLANQTRNLSNEGLGLSNAGQYYSNQGQQINNANALGSGRDIFAISGMGGSNDAYDSSYQGKVYNDAMRNERNSNIMSTLGALGGLAFSDKRLKENLKHVGKLNNGLKVYVGNYKKETGLDTTPQLFLLAQEVQKKKPEAVQKKFGALAVDYKLATKKGE